MKPGYPGKTAGVTVDPANGDLYMVVPDQGLWKSTDHGKSFARIDGKKIGGRCETGFALDFDPAEQMVVVGKQGFHETVDGGKTWKLAAPLPPDFGVGLVGPNYAWDAQANIFYASSMGKDTFKLERPAK